MKTGAIIGVTIIACDIIVIILLHMLSGTLWWASYSQEIGLSIIVIGILALIITFIRNYDLKIEKSNTKDGTF